MQEMQVQSPGQEVPLEKEMATHSNILAWEIPWTKEPDSQQSMGFNSFELATKQQPPQTDNYNDNNIGGNIYHMDSWLNPQKWRYKIMNGKDDIKFKKVVTSTKRREKKLRSSIWGTLIVSVTFWLNSRATNVLILFSVPFLVYQNISLIKRAISTWKYL